MTKRYEVMKDLSPWCEAGMVIETDENRNLPYPRSRSSVNKANVINGLMYEHDIPAYIDAGFIREVPEAKPRWFKRTGGFSPNMVAVVRFDANGKQAERISGMGELNIWDPETPFWAATNDGYTEITEAEYNELRAELTKPKVAEYELTEVTAYNGVLWTHFDDVDHKIPVDAISRRASFAGFLSSDKEEMWTDPMWRDGLGNLYGTPKAGNGTSTLVRPGYVRWKKEKA